MGLLDSIPGMGFDASSTGTAGLLTPQDKLMALFSGLTNAGVMMAQPGLGKGQALAMGLGGLGQGIQKGNQMALQQRLVEQRLAEQQRKQLAQDRFATMISMGANGPRADAGGAGGVGSLSAEQRGIMSSLAAVDPGAAATLYGKSMEFNKPKDRLQEINGKLYNVSDPMKPVEVANAQRPQQALGQLFEEQKKYTPGSPEYNAYQSAIQQQQIRDGFRVDPSGAMAPVRGGPGDPGYIERKSYATAAGEAPFKTVPYTAGGGVVAPFAGSRGVMGALPGYGLPGTGATGASASPAGSPPRLSQPPTVGGLPITGGNPPPPSDPRVVFKDQTVGQQPAEIEKYLAERFVETQKGAIDARNKNASLDRLGTLLDQAYTGTGGDTVLAAQKAAKALGFDLGNPAPAEAGRALANEMSLQLRNPSGGAGMPGAMSDKDREFLQSMTPGLGMTPEGRAVLVDALRRVNKRNEDIGAFSRQYARDHGGRLDLNFEDEVSKRFSGTDMFGDLAKKMPTADPLTEARAAIAKGAPRDAVIDRLKRAGIDASGL